MFATVNVYAVVLSLVLIVSSAGYAWAIKRHFKTIDGVMDPKMRSLAIAGGITLLVHLYCLMTTEITTLQFYAGLAIGGFALLLFMLAIRSTRNTRFALAFSKEQPAEIVTTGPYSWFRHPFYIAYTLTWLMTVAATLQPAAVVSTAMMICFYLGAAWSEEKLILNGPSASVYLKYRSKVGLFWPKLR